MGGFRIGAGVRLKGWTAVFILLFFATFYMVWWSLLLCGWAIYGTYWVFYKFIEWCVKEIKGLNKNKTVNTDEET